MTRVVCLMGIVATYINVFIICVIVSGTHCHLICQKSTNKSDEIHATKWTKLIISSQSKLRQLVDSDIPKIVQ